MNNKQETQVTLLKYNLKLLEDSLLTLKLSFKKCQKIGLKKDYSFEELESFDSLTSKFARTSDIFTQKVLRSVFIIIREDDGTFIDRANKAEKLTLITKADELIAIRDLRNEIAHEYRPEKIELLFEDIFELMGPLVLSIQKTQNYIHKIKMPTLKP